MANKLNAEVPFPQAGEGIFLRFALPDIASLEDIYGVGEVLETVDRNLQSGSAKTLLQCLEYGMKTRGEDEKTKRVKYDPDKHELQVLECHIPVMDALCLSVVGLDYTQMLKEIEEGQEALRKQAEAIKREEENRSNPLPDSEAQDDSKQSDTEAG